MLHQLSAYHDEPHKPCTYCVICGQDNPVGDCDGPFETSLETAAFKNQFDTIFAKPVIISKELKKIIDNERVGR